MQAVLALHADNTHLYPGARLMIDHAWPLPGRSREVVVVFRDHSHAEAMLMPSGEAFVLRAAAYSTAAGTVVESKSWHLRITGDRTLSVKSRADSPLL